MSASETYEQALLRDAQDGDRDAYSELQRLLEPDIRRYVRRKLYDPFTVDDVLQETFLAFYRNLARIHPVENLRPYLFRIARNKCYDVLRRVQRRSEDVSLDDEPVRLSVSYTQAHRQPKPDDLTHWVLLQLEVEEAMQQLPDSQRETLSLYSEEQLTYAEIADIMACSIGTVKSRLYYAKKNLRGLLHPETLDVLDQEFSSPQRNATDDNTDPERETDDITINHRDEDNHEQSVSTA
jgi:RNA polymerase sigma-70 factor (ECF subfamily)